MRQRKEYKMNKNGISRDFVIKQFNRYYQAKWLDEGKTAEQFVRAIQAVMPEGTEKCNYKIVSKWKKGVIAPVKYLPAICKVLDVDIEEFNPTTHNDRYQYASDFADGLEGKMEEIAMKNFKIDLTFLQGLRNIIPDFDEKFPCFTPLFHYGVEDSKHKVYERCVAGEASETSKGKGILQIEKGGKTFFLRKEDLKIIRIIQDKLKERALKLFDVIRAEMIKAEAEVNLLHEEKSTELNPDYPENETIWIDYEFTDEELQEHDKLGIYSEKERKRYKLPPKGTPIFREDDTETEG